ncbi:MAG TPA: ankyrin repeat domain-containing protein, partial [Chthonomonadaceae bacterium]|nr:ankyrin repeat domain-containing protein [Chthonomonadaceae bacterium]
MPRHDSPAGPIDSLKKSAKRWLAAIQSGDEEARARLRRAYPGAPAQPALRDVQHALAVEHGHSGWLALTRAVAHAAPATARAEGRATESLVAWFLDNACPDHHVRGGPDHRMALRTADSLLRRHPEIATASLAAAAVCGELSEVRRILRADPGAAAKPTGTPSAARSGPGDSGDLWKDVGPKGWEPLLYVCFARISRPEAAGRSVAIARVLLDCGADPNAYFMAGDSRYTPLVGVIGGGEESRPPHPMRDALTRLLLERGAEPYDMQALYNLHVRGDILWFLKAIYARSVKIGRRSDWDDPAWQMLGMGGYGNGARYLLGLAIQRNDLALARWILAHGGSPEPAAGDDPNASKDPLRERALRRGLTEMAALLRPAIDRTARGPAHPPGAEAGAPVTPPQAVPAGTVPQDEADAFAAACMAVDRQAAQAIVARRPQLLAAPGPLFTAARQDRADVAALLLDLGVSPDLEYARRGTRALHEAAYNDSARVATLLLARGAETDPVDRSHGGTPLWFAIWSGAERAIDVLTPASRDIRSLATIGAVDRLREVLGAEPELARQRTGQWTPLMQLPGEPERAAAIAAMLLRHGADPTVRDAAGRTAAERARRRGLDDAAALLDAAAARAAADEAPTPAEGSGSTAGPNGAGDARSSAVPDRVPAAVQAETGTRSAWSAGGAAASPLAAPPAFSIDWKRNDLLLRGQVANRDWEAVCGLMSENGLTGLQANGHLTDAAMPRLAKLAKLTRIDASGSKRLTDAGTLALRNMPQIEELDLSGREMQITDAGLDSLRHLRALRRFQMCWSERISDAGAGNLA